MAQLHVSPWGALALGALVLLAGCLPSSCQRMESTTVLPSDSLSRAIAGGVAIDTLELEWTATGTEPSPFQFPRTVRFGPADTIYVADVERNSIFVIVGEGGFTEIDLPGIDVPYLAGVAGDTVSLFSPGSLTHYRLHDGRVIDSTVVVDPERARTSLVYGAAGSRLYYKRVDPDKPGFIATLSRDGEPLDTTHLDGPHWRYSGLLKTWGDSLISLSGFRPVIDLVVPDAYRTGESGVDTLALIGFDSPMLARSRSFMRGDVHEAPLLSSSAAAAGDRLFVLNIRAGWLQVDVFGRDGVLQSRLVEPGANYQSAFFPQDIDVRETDGGFEIAVVYSEPEPALRLYLWTPYGSHGEMEGTADAEERTESQTGRQ